MCCHYPVKSSAWQGGVSHHELITLRYSSEVTLKFWTSAVLNQPGRFCFFLFFFFWGHDYFILRVFLQTALASNCQYVPLKDSIHCTQWLKKDKWLLIGEERQMKMFIFSLLSIYRVFKSDNGSLPLWLVCTGVLFTESYRYTGQARPAW